MTEPTKEIIDKLNDIRLKQAVTHTKLEAIEKRLDKNDKSLDTLDKRIDKHDIYVGGVMIAVAILGVLVRFKIL